MIRLLNFIADCIANVVVVIGLPFVVALDVAYGLTGWARRCSASTTPSKPTAFSAHQAGLRGAQ